MALKHSPRRSDLASSDTASINQDLADNDALSDETVFRRIGNTQMVSVVIAGYDDADAPISATDYEVDIERSLDAGETWAVHKTYTGPVSEDVPYPNGAVLWRFRLVDKGSAEYVRIQATA